MFGLGIGLRIDGGGGRVNPVVAHFGSNLVLAADSEHVAVSAGNLVSAADQSGSGNTLTMSGANPATYTASGGIQNRPFVTFVASSCVLGIGSNIVATGADRTVYHVFKAVAGTTDLCAFKFPAPTFAVRFSSGLGTTSDEASFNNTGTYTFDTTGVHIVESQYHFAAVSTYTLDGSLITQGGATVSTSDSGTAGFQINGGAAPGGQIWYATYVVNTVTSGADDTFMLAFLRSKYT